MATRKINIRIVLLYTLAVITASFVVPSTHPFLNGHAPSVGAKSIFIIAVVEAGLPKLAHFLNAFYLFSAFTCAVNNIYVSSRILHTLALRRQTGPEFITKRLRQCRQGVPIRAVLVSSLGWLLGYMGRTGSVGQVCCSSAYFLLLFPRSSAANGNFGIDETRDCTSSRPTAQSHGWSSTSPLQPPISASSERTSYLPSTTHSFAHLTLQFPH